MKSENLRKPTDRARIARLRAAGLTVEEIGRAVGLSKQRVSQILAAEQLPAVGKRAIIHVDGQRTSVESDTDSRIIHAAITRALRGIGITVETRQEGE